MTDKLLRHLDDLDNLGPSAPTTGTPGRAPASARIAARPQIVFRVESAEAARELAGAFGPRDRNGVSAHADVALDRASGSAGAPLPDDVRGRFESSLGADLSAVRVHTGADSATAAQAVGAKAYTVGNDIHFGAGHYAPSDPFGVHLLAHEVAHTQQQGGSAGGAPQCKLEVSTPGDSAEVEADRAADAMVRGESVQLGGNGTGVIHRDAFLDDLERKSGPDNGPGLPGGGPVDLRPKGPSLWAPDTDITGVPYQIPTADYRAQAKPQTPPIDAAMPPAQINDPGSIPGWKTIKPAQSFSIGPFTQVEPAREHTVLGDMHSKIGKEAWAAYKDDLIPSVKRTWDNEVVPKVDSYTAQAQGDANLNQLVDDTRKKYDIASIQQHGGSLSDQFGKQTLTKGGPTAPGVSAQVQQGGADFHKDVAATAAQPTDTTVASPVKNAVNALNNQRDITRGLMLQMSGTTTGLDGAKDAVLAAETELQQVADAKEEKQKDPIFDAAKKVASRVHPKLGKLVAEIQFFKEPLIKIAGIAASAAKVAVSAEAGDAKGALKGVVDIGAGVIDVHKWYQLNVMVQDIMPAAPNKYLLRLGAARKSVIQAAEVGLGLAKAIEASIREEKIKYEAVATELEKSGQWKGKSSEDAKVAANAMRAIPVVERIVRVLKEMKGAFPSAPSGGTRGSQGFVLATQGIGAPGAADLINVAGWIAGAQIMIAPEIKKWELIRTQLESVAKSLGVE